MTLAVEEPRRTTLPAEKETTVGNYFVSNYPPFSFWKPERVPEVAAALGRPPQPGTRLGLYLHIPFCRKRCHFCYFRVYTDNYQEMKAQGRLTAPVADWETKRGWVRYAFAELEKAGYTVASGYTAVKDPERTRFVYRDSLWQGADLIGLGVASFSHVGGTHFQNEHDFEPYVARLREGRLPLYRALTPTAEERLIRELVLQFKLGQISRAYFERKFGVDVLAKFAGPFPRGK